MSVIVSQNSRSYNAGSRQFDAALDPTWSMVQITMTREAWPVGLHISATFEFSDDNGGAYVFLARLTSDGGIATNGAGDVMPASILRVKNLPFVGSTTRRMRATFVNDVTCTTAITVEAF